VLNKFHKRVEKQEENISGFILNQYWAACNINTCNKYIVRTIT